MTGLYQRKTDNRPEFQHMIKDSARGLFDVVLVWKLDRFARNRYDSARYKNILKKNGIKVISAREQIAFFIYCFRKFDVTKREQRVAQGGMK